MDGNDVIRFPESQQVMLCAIELAEQYNIGAVGVFRAATLEQWPSAPGNRQVWNDCHGHDQRGAQRRDP
jgi:hypothetical protein